MSLRIESQPSVDLIPAVLKPAITDVVTIYQDTFRSRLQSVYLLGGAARGEYRPGISDFDIRGIVTTKHEGEKQQVDQLAAPLQKQYNLGKMELDAYTLNGLQKRPWLQFYVLTDGVCLWGNPYEATTPLPTTKEDLAKLLASHLLEHYGRLPEAIARLQAGEELKDFEGWQTHAKRAIRLGNVISILKTGIYTQNSDRMVENILRNVPEISEPITKLNQYRMDPPTTHEDYVDFAKQAEVVKEAVLSYGFQKESTDSQPHLP